jgi:hypothetical protein
VYTKPVFSLLGSRDRYSVEVVPYFDSTDHLVFDTAIIGTAHGGITFTNWPDEYIHSSGDDLWQVDRTMLKRNAVAVSALTLFMANAGPADVKMMTTLMVPAGLQRIGRDLQAVADQRYAGFDRNNVAIQSLNRETAAIQSLRTITTAAADLQLLDSAVKELKSATAQLAAFAPCSCPVAGSESLAGKVPVPIESVADFIKKDEDMKHVPGLHSLMSFEALNFADEKRTVWDIYSAVRAESLATGEWYYGEVRPELIQKLFDNAVAAGTVTMKPAAPPPSPTKKKPGKKS